MSTVESSYDNLTKPVRAKLGGVTNAIVDGVHKYSNGKIDKVSATRAMPYVAAGVGALGGYFLIGPAEKLSKLVFSGVRQLVTGFGYFEKIPAVGGFFTAVGDAVDTVGEYAGNAAPVVLGFLGYEMFKGKSRVPPTATDNLGRVPGAVVLEQFKAETPDGRHTEFELPAAAKRDPLPSATKARVVTATGKADPSITLALAARARLLSDSKFGPGSELEKAMEDYLGHELQIYEDNRALARFIAADRETDARGKVAALFTKAQNQLAKTFDLTPEEAAAFLPKDPLLRPTIYDKGDHTQEGRTVKIDYSEINKLLASHHSPVRLKNDGPLADFAKEFQQCYGQGWVTVNDGKGKQVALNFVTMTVSQQLEFLGKALVLAKKRKKEMIKELEYNAQNTPTGWFAVQGTSLFHTKGAFNYMDVRGGAADEVMLRIKAYNQLTYDPREELAGAKDYSPAPDRVFGLMAKASEATSDNYYTGRTQFVTEQLPAYTILREREHEFLLKVDGCDKALMEDKLEYGQIHGYKKVNYDNYNGRNVSNGMLDGTVVIGKGAKKDTKFLTHVNANKQNLFAEFDQWKKDLEAHHEDLRRKVAAYELEKKELKEFKLKLLKETGIAVISNNAVEGKGQHTLSVVDVTTGVRYTFTVDGATKKITHYSGISSEPEALAQPVDCDAGSNSSLMKALPVAVASAQVLNEKQQKIKALKDNGIEIIEKGVTGIGADHRTQMYLIAQVANPNAPGVQYKITYNSSGTILDIKVRHPGGVFKATEASYSLDMKIKDRTPLHMNPSNPGQSLKAFIAAYENELKLIREAAVPKPEMQAKQQAAAKLVGVTLVQYGIGKHPSRIASGAGEENPYVIAELAGTKPEGMRYKIFYDKHSGHVTHTQIKMPEAKEFAAATVAPLNIGVNLKLDGKMGESVKTFIQSDQGNRTYQAETTKAQKPAKEQMADEVAKRRNLFISDPKTRPATRSSLPDDKYIEVTQILADGKMDASKASYTLYYDDAGKVTSVSANTVRGQSNALFSTAITHVISEMQAKNTPLTIGKKEAMYAPVRQMIDRVETMAIELGKPGSKLAGEARKARQAIQKQFEDAQQVAFTKVTTPEQYGSDASEKAVYILVKQLDDKGAEDTTKARYKIYHDEAGQVMRITMKKAGEANFTCPENCQRKAISLQASATPVITADDRMHMHLRTIVDSIEAFKTPVTGPRLVVSKEPATEKKASAVKSSYRVSYEKIAAAELYDTPETGKAKYMLVKELTATGAEDTTRPQFKIYHDDKGKLLKIKVKKSGQKDFTSSSAADQTMKIKNMAYDDAVISPDRNISETLRGIIDLLAERENEKVIDLGALGKHMKELKIVPDAQELCSLEFGHGLPSVAKLLHAV